MTLVIPPGFALASLYFQLAEDAEMMATTMGIDVASTGTTEAAAINANMHTQYPAAGMLTGYSYRGCRLAVGQDGTPPVIIEAPDLIVGTAGGGPLPNNCALLMRKTSLRGGRMGRGRMYWPPFCIGEGGVDGRGIINDATLADNQTRLSGVFDSVNKVILHDSDSPGSHTPDAIVSLLLQRQIGTQRRRMRP